MSAWIFGTVPRRRIQPYAREGESFSTNDSILAPLLYTTSTSRHDDQFERPLLRCPLCGSITVHITHVDFAPEGERPPTTLRVRREGSASQIPSDETHIGQRFNNRGANIGIGLFCELGHESVLEFGQHKGTTFAEVRSRAAATDADLD